MDKKSSILDDLKAQKMPYGVPDGYFDNLRIRLESIPSEMEGKKTAPAKLMEVYGLDAAHIAEAARKVLKRK